MSGRGATFDVAHGSAKAILAIEEESHEWVAMRKAFAFPAAAEPRKGDVAKLKLSIRKCDLALLKSMAKARDLSVEEMARVAIAGYQSVQDKLMEAVSACGEATDECGRIRFKSASLARQILDEVAK